MHGGPAAAELCGLDPISCCKGRCCGCSWGTRAPCPSCCRSAGGAHAPRTRPCSACCPWLSHWRRAARKGPGLRPQARGLVRHWASTTWPVPGGPRGHVMLQGGSLAAGAAWVCIGARLGAGLALRRPSWVRAAQLVPPLGWSRSAPPRATPRRASSHGCHRGRRLYRGGGGAAVPVAPTAGAGIGRCRRLTLGGRWLHAGRWGRRLGAQQPPGQPGDHGDPLRPSAAYIRQRCRVSGAAGSGGKGQGADAGALDGGAEGADASGAAGDHWSDWGGRACAAVSGRHGCGC